MLKNLLAFYEITKEGGKVVIHTRNWDKVLKEGQSYQALPMRKYESNKYIPVYNWNISEFNESS